jgi:hypothetical protein
VSNKLDNTQHLILPSPIAYRPHFARNSSLSTISEEKTIETIAADSSSYIRRDEHSNGPVVFLIEDILVDVQKGASLFGEILRVFEPSSKRGIFVRNVPVRFTSPIKAHKDNDAFEGSPTCSSSPTISATSSHYISPSSYSFDTSKKASF